MDDNCTCSLANLAREIALIFSLITELLDSFRSMVWNNDKDVLLCREILVVEPYKFKEKTRERGTAWTLLSDNLNQVSGFTVNMRAVRECFKLLEAKYKKKNNEELKATGISPEESEIDVLLEEIIIRMKEITFGDENKEKEQSDKMLGEEIRQQALETYTESKKRKPLEDKSPTSIKRKITSGNETVSFLRERMEGENCYREREMEVRNSKTGSSRCEQTTNRHDAINAKFNAANAAIYCCSGSIPKYSKPGATDSVRKVGKKIKL